MSKLGPTDQVYEQFKKKLQSLTIIIGLELKYSMDTINAMLTHFRVFGYGCQGCLQVLNQLLGRRGAFLCQKLFVFIPRLCFWAVAARRRIAKFQIVQEHLRKFRKTMEKSRKFEENCMLVY